MNTFYMVTAFHPRINHHTAICNSGINHNPFPLQLLLRYLAIAAKAPQ